MTKRLVLIAALVPLFGCEPEPPAEAPPTAERTAAVAAEPTSEIPKPVEAAPADEAPAEAAPSEGIAGIAGVAPAKKEAPAAGKVKAEDFDLGKVSKALESHAVKDGDGLERYINDKDNSVTRVDIDGDGTVDVVEIEEQRESDAVAFQIRAVPSSTKRVEDAVTIAVVRIRPERREKRIVVVSRYTEVVIVEEHHHHEYTYVEHVDYDDDGLIVLAPHQVFFGWLFMVERPIYESVFIYTLDRHLVRPHRVVVDVVDHCWPPGHCKHHKRHKHHGRYKYSKRHKKYGKHGKRGKRGKGGKHGKHGRH